MLVFAHKHHQYEDLASRVVYQFSEGTALDVSDEIGLMVTEAHPMKLCDVSRETNPESHVCELSVQRNEYENTAIKEPEYTTAMTTQPLVSRGHQKKIKNPAAHRAKARYDRLTKQ